jgi:hypothetical protein
MKLRLGVLSIVEIIITMIYCQYGQKISDQVQLVDLRD